MATILSRPECVKISQRLYKKWLSAYVEADLCRHMASLGPNDYMSVGIFVGEVNQ